MLAQRSVCRFAGRNAISDQAFRFFRPGSDGSFSAFVRASRNSDQSLKSLYKIPQNSDSFPGCLKNLKGASHFHDSPMMGANSSVGSQFLGNIGMQLSFMKATDVVTPPYAVSFRSFIHSVGKKEIETGRNSRSMNFVRGIIEEDGKGGTNGYQFSRYNVEQNADIVHIKLLRNNTFVTVTDSKGNKKIGASSGSLSEMKGGPKASRYAAEATAEHVGRLARKMGLKSVVMKVNGFIFFKKKKQAILSFREGYTQSRGDQNPVVYIEDTTQRPHNGCRLRKKRRV